MKIQSNNQLAPCACVAGANCGIACVAWPGGPRTAVCYARPLVLPTMPVVRTTIDCSYNCQGQIKSCCRTQEWRGHSGQSQCNHKPMQFWIAILGSTSTFPREYWRFPPKSFQCVEKTCRKSVRAWLTCDYGMSERILKWSERVCNIPSKNSSTVPVPNQYRSSPAKVLNGNRNDTVWVRYSSLFWYRSPF